MAGVIGAEIICTDESCAVTIDVVVDSLERLDLACDDCGCAIQVISVWDVVELRPATAPVVMTLRGTQPPLAA